MDTHGSDEDVIVRYLLGELPEDEQARLEERAFADQRFTEEILAVEGDLLDEYVRGGLTGPRRARFEDRFFASAERRRKVEFARALARVTAATQAAGQPARVGWWEATLASLRNLTPPLRFAMAAALLLFVCVSWLVAERVRLGAEVARLEAVRQMQQRQAADERARSAELTAALERERQRVAEMGRRPGGAQAEGGAAAGPLILSLFLPPGVTRAAAGRPQLVLPPPEAPQARLEIGLEPEDEFARFRVEVRTLAGQQVWSEGDLRPQQSRAGRVVSLTVPGRVLAAGRYELQLQGVVDSSTAEVVRYYYFDVLQQ